jgi:uncharacterized protein (TIGR00251 family)
VGAEKKHKRSSPQAGRHTIGRPGVLTVFVQPRAARTEVVGPHGDGIKIRVHAPPIDGAANEELVRFLARQLGVPKTSVAIMSGAGSRRKLVSVTGGPPDLLTYLLRGA